MVSEGDKQLLVPGAGYVWSYARPMSRKWMPRNGHQMLAVEQRVVVGLGLDIRMVCNCGWHTAPGLVADEGPHWALHIFEMHLSSC
jgi:hypothetical protein